MGVEWGIIISFRSHRCTQKGRSGCQWLRKNDPCGVNRVKPITLSFDISDLPWKSLEYVDLTNLDELEKPCKN